MCFFRGEITCKRRVESSLLVVIYEYVSRDKRDVGLQKNKFSQSKKCQKKLIDFNKSTKGYGPRQEVGLGLRLFAVFFSRIA